MPTCGVVPIRVAGRRNSSDLAAFAVQRRARILQEEPVGGQGSCPFGRIAALIGEEATLILVAFLGSDSMRDRQTEITQLLTKGLPGDSQHPCGLMLAPLGELQDERQQQPVQLLVDSGVEVAGAGLELLSDKRFKVRVALDGL